ncbi:RNA 2',3'-cyclic phosphodiesterase [Neobacillus sp. DY30]|uniref:RNA 2',3'-cyclic phosphodiesterase n=1 Tax=Neobacillus sp. DY30 TaxID=3047871 RepID=UPI0024BF3B9E|nr:RNA 2',3'-cyclic phosphodiesterase [Neobacillus sp. DY30]WHX99654.1 RNA 2',3'-cyclic phosphodiesterase [Neobacillus sp. DY30]
MNKHTHFFFAIKIPTEIKLIMQSNIERLKEILPFSRWVHHEDLHITLAFLGNAPSEKLSIALENVREALSEFKGFSLEINKLGTFGKADSPRIFWMDTKESNELSNVREKVFTACVEAGFQLETRPFKPHITLARKWSGNQVFHKSLLDTWIELQSEPLVFNVNEVVLYQTHLDKTPKYEVKTTYYLDSEI